MPDCDVGDIAPIQMHSMSRTKSGESLHIGSALATPVSGQRQSRVVGGPQGWRKRRSPAPIKSGVKIGTVAVPLIYEERPKEDDNDNKPRVGIQEVDYEVDEEYKADEEAYEEIDEVNLSDDSEDDGLALLDPDEVDLGGFEDIDGDDPMDEDTEETSDDDEPSTHVAPGKKSLDDNSAK
ncbi:hypothetical protein BKA56DRAFT_617314 [Ilyonectria sp. MPI-CAGE-AT-0026]|nr:hypothetical protein BKA56DRAFT_617314 [Ilyonectria sp. MPI-CAGE-AT-0026]